MPIAVIAVLFPAPGAQPYRLWDFLCDLVVCGLVAFVVPKRFAAMRWGALLYGLVLVAAFVVATPLGGNVSCSGPAPTCPGPPLGAAWYCTHFTYALDAVPGNRERVSGGVSRQIGGWRGPRCTNGRSTASTASSTVPAS